jgi:hypothetical protein
MRKVGMLLLVLPLYGRESAAASPVVLTAAQVLVCPIAVPPWPANRATCSKAPLFASLPNTVNPVASGSKAAPFWNHTFDGYLASDLVVACPIGAAVNAGTCTYAGKDASALVAKAAVATFSVVATPPATGNTFTLTWTAPSQNTDGSALTNLASYNIYQGGSTTALVKLASVPAASPTYTTAVLPAIATGYYFAVTAVNSAGVESARAGPVSSIIVTPSVPTNLKVTANLGATHT